MQGLIRIGMNVIDGKPKSRSDCTTIRTEIGLALMLVVNHDESHLTQSQSVSES